MTSQYLKPIPDRLRATRQALGMTQREVARKAYVSNSYIAMLESGQRLKARYEMLDRIAEVLNVDVAQISTNL